MSRRRAMWLLGSAALGLFLVLGLLDLRMQDAGGPGIVQFELAGDERRASEILEQWGPDGRSAARASLWLDFPFLLAYSAFLSLAALAVRDAARPRGWARFARAGSAIAVVAWVAGACDVVENVNLLVTLEGHGDGTAPALALAFASVKFVALALVAAYLLGGLALRRGGPPGEAD